MTYKNIIFYIMLVALPNNAESFGLKDSARLVIGSLVLVGAWESLKKTDNAWERANSITTMTESQLLTIGAKTKVGKVSQFIARARKKLLNEPEPTQQELKKQFVLDTAKIFTRRFGSFFVWSTCTTVLTVAGIKLMGKALL